MSLPEVPLLAVLPGTGGLTRLVDKRRVRRDRADFFCTTGEGVRGERAVEWRLVDEVVPRRQLRDAALRKAAETWPARRVLRMRRASCCVRSRGASTAIASCTAI